MYITVISNTSGEIMIQTLKNQHSRVHGKWARLGRPTWQPVVDGDGLVMMTATAWLSYAVEYLHTLNKAYDTVFKHIQ